MRFFKNNITNYLVLFVIALLTLNYQDHNFYSSLDFSLFWSFNYLFEYRPHELDKISFIYGPLAFLRSPTCYGNQILIVCALQTILKFLMGWCLLKLADLMAAPKKLAILLFFLSCFVAFSFECYTALPVILLLTIWHFEPKTLYLALAAILTALGYYIKCSIGLGCFLIQAGFAIFIMISERKLDIKFILRIKLLNIAAILIFGLCIFKSLKPVLRTALNYFYNLLYYNGVSSSYNSPDNFLLLGLLALALVLIFFMNHNRAFRLFWLMTLIFLYTGYTYSMIRMDLVHYSTFITYFFSVAVCCGVFYKSCSKTTYYLLGLAFLCYYTNLWNKWDYSDYTFSIQNGPRNIYSYILHNKQHKIDVFNSSLGGLYPEVKLKDEKVLAELKSGNSIDFYPWELSFVEANRFDKWKPRPYLQSLIMLSHFDKKTAGWFSSGEAPERLIWHHAFDTSEFFHSLDDSYLLTNQFNSAISIISNYSVFAHTNAHLYLKKTDRSLTNTISDHGKEITTQPGKWINVPDGPGITVCTVKYHFNLLHTLKKLAYRDDSFYIEYRTEDNTIIKRRFWPSNNSDLLLVSPYILSPSDLSSYKKIKQVRFTNTNSAIRSNDISVQFKTLRIKGLEPDSNDFSGLYKWFSNSL